LRRQLEDAKDKQNKLEKDKSQAQRTLDENKDAMEQLENRLMDLEKEFDKLHNELDGLQSQSSTTDNDVTKKKIRNLKHWKLMSKTLREIYLMNKT